MSVLHRIRMSLRGFGVELNRYTPAQSSDARLCRLLERLGVDLVVDVGANDGGFATGLRAAGFAGDIVSFEPLQEAHTLLARAAAHDARWHVMPRMALGEREGSVQINVAGNSTSSSILPMQAAHRNAAPASHYVGAQSVDLKRLDNLSHPSLDKARAIHLKVDTQGFEMPVLLGAVGLLPRVCSMQLELSLVSLYEGQALYRSVIDWVTDQGFELCGVVPGFVDERSGRMLQMDGLFARPQAA